MRSLYIIRGPLCRSPLARPPHIIKRHKFSGRTTPADKRKAYSLPSTPARTRFAPSPTGYVHIGSLRTALYNYLLAKATGGQFVLRVEDTDQARTVSDAEPRLYEDLKWAGLSWDEGPDVGGPYGPYRQSDRLETYTKYAAQLIDEGHAYRCFCTAEQLDEMRTISMREGNPTVYNGTCIPIPPDVSARRAANGEPHCVRFRCDHAPVVNDLVYKAYAKPGPEDDFIIIKQDGFPTYHFANVVDDYLMKITHVIRGAEWLVSTPRHVALYEAFGWTPPQFAHVGLLVNKEKQKLSKRHGDVDIASWRDRGILPVTLLNYVMLLGWSFGIGVKGRDEVMSLNEMVSKFDLRFTKGDIIVNEKDKFLQKEHIKRLARAGDPASFTSVLLPPVEAQIRKHQADLQEYIRTRGEAGGPVARRVGPMVPLARPRPREEVEEDDGDVVSRCYVKNLLRLDIQQYKDAASFVLRNKYSIWTIRPLAYREALRRETAGILALSTIPHVNPSAPRAAAPPPETPRTIPELVALLRDVVRGVGDGRWEVRAIRKAVMGLLTSVHARTRTQRELGGGAATTVVDTERWGFALARWILAASEPGPNVYCTMELLGKEETMRRIDVAYEIAIEEETRSRAEGGGGE
ncbi:mitochondrial 37S ribosomal protein rsm10 [Hypoxylon texense]